MWNDTGHGHLALRGVVAGIDEAVGVIPQPVALEVTWSWRNLSERAGQKGRRNGAGFGYAGEPPAFPRGSEVPAHPCRWLVGRSSSEARHAPAGGTACRLSPAAGLMAVNTDGGGRLREFVEQRFGGSQVGRIEALGKPVVDLDQ